MASGRGWLDRGQAITARWEFPREARRVERVVRPFVAAAKAPTRTSAARLGEICPGRGTLESPPPRNGSRAHWPISSEIAPDLAPCDALPRHVDARASRVREPARLRARALVSGPSSLLFASLALREAGASPKNASSPIDAIS
ncbi:hypothetical protein GLOTRDRAFT_130329 [Gloeophyllum trabeum ATCC 11539]|uniref:Uncharacterized protein n=1 Tax=Gloeophyllum trabeum (strain ATCC 11539 / FP-39264 / Madison 617) TaxID=670483 RepID=S7RI21_GLOTA|nr:uncharacterized protein GLOTRDRAFT_130329 [Gloeophyllum trabeum ATCC 11539]EPQ53930.1 hypothetical protein GLOTRDRAFT_130329 [Gloeophyllum trabeum ATCC 11539]